MRFVLGLSLTASSAVWVLVDTANGKILADEVVSLDSLHEIARATARSVQAFDAQTGHDIEGVRMTWSDDARQHGIRLRTKLRLFGFETVQTVSQDHAREGRTRTARHIAPHLALAYGAAHGDLKGDKGTSVLPRPAARVAAAVCAATVVGVGLYALMGPSPSEAPDTAAAESAPAQSGQPVRPAPAAAPSVVPAPQAAQPVAVPVAQPVPVPEPVAVPEQVAVPEPVAAWQPVGTAGESEGYVAPEAATEIALDSTVPEMISASVGEPHLSAAQPAAGPDQVTEPVTIVPQPVLPPQLPPVLSSFLSALP